MNLESYMYLQYNDTKLHSMQAEAIVSQPLMYLVVPQQLNQGDWCELAQRMSTERYQVCREQL